MIGREDSYLIISIATVLLIPRPFHVVLSLSTMRRRRLCVRELLDDETLPVADIAVVKRRTQNATALCTRVLIRALTFRTTSRVEGTGVADHSVC